MAAALLTGYIIRTDLAGTLALVLALPVLIVFAIFIVYFVIGPFTTAHGGFTRALQKGR